MTKVSNYPRRVAVLGAGGHIGRAACAGLVARGHWVRGVDVVQRQIEGVDDFRIVDICDAQALRATLEGMEMVIHLAGVKTEGDPRDVLLGPSYLGVWRIYEAAKDTGTERLVVTSTNQVILNLEEQDRIVGADSPYNPGSFYAVSKIFLEILGRYYASTRQMSILIVRPGWLPHNRQDMATIGTSLRRRNMYLSFNDAARFFACCVETDKLPKPGVEVVYAQSLGEKTDGGLDREPARHLLGYEGQDVWPNGCPGLA